MRGWFPDVGGVSKTSGSVLHPFEAGVPTGIRTPVTAVKGRCPRPLDDGDCGSVGGGNRDRTGDLLHAMQALSQLSYTPNQGAKLYQGNSFLSRSSTRPFLKT